MGTVQKNDKVNVEMHFINIIEGSERIHFQPEMK